MAENDGANADDSEWKRVLIAYMCVRVQRLREKQAFEVEMESITVSKDMEDIICANNFAIAAVAAESLPRAIIIFQRSAWWFEETKPYFVTTASSKLPGNASYIQVLGGVLSLFRAVPNHSDKGPDQSPLKSVWPWAFICRLCSTAEDRTIAHLFGIGRSMVNVLFKEFCAAVITIREDDWVGMVPTDGMVVHMRGFHAVTEFPQAVGALDCWHFPVSRPQASARS
ncbi:hypothetical protein HPB48_003098 [Haemaphysalis longicornis]|uniref:Uncharacterized protein n=1 Tax=Haemaphysalis longicornis TaxID=44386 RepID=A0A9J6FZN1_HAELO|nr:hypothetical protein HPB48_003098 [Haemaphysalis longicornis]